MDGQQDVHGDVYREYRREVEGKPLTRALKRAVFVLFAINTVFILVDWIVYPAKFWPFLPVRLALDIALGAIFFVASEKYPVASSFATSFAGGAMLFAVVFGTGGASSDYYVGLVLLFIGIGVLAPLSAKQGGIAIGTLFSVYAVIPLLNQSSTPVQSSAVSLFFLGAAAFMGIMSCAYLDRMRFGDFCQRRELEKASEELKELDREKSRFTANVHHELRTPLTLMLAPIDAFLVGDFGEVSGDQRRYLESMQSNGQRLLKLINNLLDLAKIEGHQLRIRRERLAIGEVVSEIVEGARPFAERKMVTVSMNALDDLPDVFADRDAIEKIIVNLVGNALKFSEPKGEIRILGALVDRDSIEVTVSDEGIGLDPKQLSRIFDRFAQVDSSNTRRHEGTGIGLALAKELIELHGGRIWAESCGIGMGTQMHVILPRGNPDPVEEADDEAAWVLEEDGSQSSGARESDAIGGDLRFVDLERNAERFERADIGTAVDEGQKPCEDRGKPLVLVVEDNADMRVLLRDILEKRFSVRVARDGKEGLRLAREVEPDLILTDVMMPEMSGTDLCREIKTDVCTKEIPIVLVTSKSERAMRIEGLEMGADDYVTKPFHPRELLARASSLVRLYRLQETLKTQNGLLESRNAELKSTLDELRSASSRLVQAERLAAVGELAAGVAHEVNNPVNFATNALRTLERNVGEIRRVAEKIEGVDWKMVRSHSPALDEIVDAIEKSAFSDSADSLDELIEIATEGLERTGRLVGDLRDFAMPNLAAGSLFDVVRGLRSTIQLVSYTLREAGVRVVTDFEKDLPLIKGNPASINQVFLNLLKNALDATKGVGDRIYVKAWRSDPEIRIRFKDEGRGISKEEIGRLFEPFFTTKPAGSGTGLGLSISRRIVSEHGGEIEVDSDLGSGSSFTVVIPIHSSGTEGRSETEAG